MPADTVFTEDSFNVIQQIRDAGLVGYEDGVTKCAEVAALRQTKFHSFGDEDENPWKNNIKNPFENLFTTLIDEAPEGWGGQKIYQGTNGCLGNLFVGGNRKIIDYYWGAVALQNHPKTESPQFFVTIRPSDIQFGFYIDAELVNADIWQAFSSLVGDEGREILEVLDGVEGVNFSKDTQDSTVFGINNGDFEIKTLDEWIALAVGDEKPSLMINMKLPKAALEEDPSIEDRIKTFYTQLHPFMEALAKKVPRSATSDSASSATSDSPTTFSSKVEEIKHILENVNPQVILYGPPGTSKTHTALEVVKNFTEGGDTRTAVGQREILLFAAKWSETKHGKGAEYYFEISQGMIDGGFFNKIGFQESVHHASNKKMFKAKFFDDNVVDLEIYNPTGSGKCRISIKGTYKRKDRKFRGGVLSNGYPKARKQLKEAQQEKNYNLNEDVTVFVLEWIDTEDGGTILSITYVNPGDDLFETYSNFIQNRHGESFAPNNKQERYWRLIRPLGNKKTPIQDREVVWDIVQFHPNYNYEDFVRGIRPRTIDGTLEFREENGPLLRMAKSAEDHPAVPHILIVDEINRAILSRVFGEAFNLLENRGEVMEISGGGTMRLPTNLYLIGTMNTADRNISTFDHALRRRFTMIPLNPSADELSGRLQECEVTVESLNLITTMFNKVQGFFQGQNSSLAVGHTYFMVKPKKEIPIQPENDGSSYESMTVIELKEELKQRGLPTSGKKADLVARLKEDEPRNEYRSQTVAKLKEKLKQRGLPTSGKKADLEARLLENDTTKTIEDQESPLEQFASNFITKIAPLLEEYRLEGVVTHSNLSGLAKHIEDVLENWRGDSTSNVFDQIKAWCTAMKENNPPPPNGHPDGLVAALAEKIRKGNRQLILAGPPGTSKTYSATEFWKELTDEMINDANQYSGMETPDRGLSRWKFGTSSTILQKKISEKGGARDVQFHPSYGYEDFVRGIEVVGGGSIPTFNEVEKVFIETVKESLANPSKLYLLRIDEINRALLSRVLGELILGLEYRNLSITLPGSQGSMSIPENLLIIGTMNTSDRNLSTVDHAIRRRFTFIHAPADPAVVRTYHGEDNEQYYNCYDKLIEAMKQDESFQSGVMIQDLLIGHTYFLTENEDEFFHNLVYQVLPLIEEYHEEGILTEEGKGRLAKVIFDHLPNFSESSTLWRSEIKAWCEERMPKDQRGEA